MNENRIFQEANGGCKDGHVLIYYMAGKECPLCAERAALNAERSRGEGLAEALNRIAAFNLYGNGHAQYEMKKIAIETLDAYSLRECPKCGGHGGAGVFIDHKFTVTEPCPACHASGLQKQEGREG